MNLRPKPLHLSDTVYEKLGRDDPALEDRFNELLSIVDAICVAGGSIDDAIQAFDGYCVSHYHCGALVLNFGPNEALGHIKPERAALNNLERLLPMDKSEIGRLFANLADSSSRAAYEEAKLWFETEIVGGVFASPATISGDPTWLFRLSDTLAEITDDAECLPWRLGLPWTTSAVPCVAYMVSASSLIACRHPTALDAKYQYIEQVWAPGGRTMLKADSPTECGGHGGFEEVVAQPVRFADIRLPISRFNARTVV